MRRYRVDGEGLGLKRNSRMPLKTTIKLAAMLAKTAIHMQAFDLA